MGAYLQGSFAVGDFDSDSDIDFIVVTADDLTPTDVAALTAIHGDNLITCSQQSTRAFLKNSRQEASYELSSGYLTLYLS